jgi:hypothetical protein
MTPFKSLLMIASSDDATMAASQAAGSSFMPAMSRYYGISRTSGRQSFEARSPLSYA